MEQTHDFYTISFNDDDDSEKLQPDFKQNTTQVELEGDVITPGLDHQRKPIYGNLIHHRRDKRYSKEIGEVRRLPMLQDDIPFHPPQTTIKPQFVYDAFAARQRDADIQARGRHDMIKKTFFKKWSPPSKETVDKMRRKVEGNRHRFNLDVIKPKTSEDRENMFKLSRKFDESLLQFKIQTLEHAVNIKPPSVRMKQIPQLLAKLKNCENKPSKREQQKSDQNDQHDQNETHEDSPCGKLSSSPKPFKNGVCKMQENSAFMKKLCKKYTKALHKLKCAAKCRDEKPVDGNKSYVVLEMPNIKLNRLPDGKAELNQIESKKQSTSASLTHLCDIKEVEHLPIFPVEEETPSVVETFIRDEKQSYRFRYWQDQQIRYKQIPNIRYEQTLKRASKVPIKRTPSSPRRQTLEVDPRSQENKDLITSFEPVRLVNKTNFTWRNKALPVGK